jgi:hypothetical protein
MSRPHVSRSVAQPRFHGSRSVSRGARAGRNANIASPRTTPRRAMTTGTTNARTVNATRNARAVRSALNTGSVRHALHNTSALRSPATRALVTTRLATAGRQDHRGHDRWWRHRHGGFGWVGPVFWPFAFYDVYDYALWGYGYGPAFWDYGYPDIYAGIFAPYGYDDLMAYGGYLPGGGGKGGRGSFASANPGDRLSLAQMCGDDSREIAGLPIDAIQKALQPDDAQRAALDDLANASVKAAQDIRAACPTEAALTAPRRIAVMQQRIEAMIAGVKLVQPPLDKFYGLLTDEQKARFNALAVRQRPARTERTASSAGPACGASQAGLTDWPGEAIEKSVRPNDDQRKSLNELRNAATSAADMLKEACLPEEALTPPARLAAVGKRLDTMLQAVKTVRAALDNFYGSLNDEQKASFDAIGPQRASTTDRQRSERRRGRRHYTSIEHMIRRMIWFAH